MNLFGDLLKVLLILFIAKHDPTLLPGAEQPREIAESVDHCL